MIMLLHEEASISSRFRSNHLDGANDVKVRFGACLGQPSEKGLTLYHNLQANADVVAQQGPLSLLSDWSTVRLHFESPFVSAAALTTRTAEVQNTHCATQKHRLDVARMKVIIVGGGLVGSLLAISLAKEDHDVHLYELRSGTCFSTVPALMLWL